MKIQDVVLGVVPLLLFVMGFFNQSYFFLSAGAGSVLGVIYLKDKFFKIGGKEK